MYISAGDVHNPVSPADGTWPRLNSPRRKKKADVFRFLTQHDPNYTIRRQELQMNIIIEKNHAVKTVSGLRPNCCAGVTHRILSKGYMRCSLVPRLISRLYEM